MDLEVGVVTPTPLAGDDRVQPAILPASHYATLTYRKPTASTLPDRWPPTARHRCQNLPSRNGR